jgi:hypothetical protein
VRRFILGPLAAGSLTGLPIFVLLVRHIFLSPVRGSTGIYGQTPLDLAATGRGGIAAQAPGNAVSVAAVRTKSQSHRAGGQFFVVVR